MTSATVVNIILDALALTAMLALLVGRSKPSGATSPQRLPWNVAGRPIGVSVLPARCLSTQSGAALSSVRAAPSRPDPEAHVTGAGDVAGASRIGASFPIGGRFRSHTLARQAER
jgi:hypothetical protein